MEHGAVWWITQPGTADEHTQEAVHKARAMTETRERALVAMQMDPSMNILDTQTAPQKMAFYGHF